VCEEAIGEAPLYLKYRLCPYCRFHYSLTARERIELVADEGSFKETNHAIRSLYPLSFSDLSSYPRRLAQDAARTGLTEAAVTGSCTINGIKVTVVVLDFGFMGGSMGSVVGEKVALAFEDAARSTVPLLALVSGGGARIQEGVLSLMQMAKTVTAANRLRDKRVPFIVVLSNPATGHAYASFANLADLILAEPGTLIGLASMKTLRQASAHPLPLDAHTAEAHLSLGLLDNVVDRELLKETMGTILGILSPSRTAGSNGKAKLKPVVTPAGERPEVARVLEIARNPRRPSSLDYIRSTVDQFMEIRGDRVSGDDRSVVGGLGYLMGERVVIIGQERHNAHKGDKFHTYPQGLRKAQRLIDLAARFKLPVITLIDTQGAHPGLESEEQGVGNAIATTLSLMAGAPTPIVSVIVGVGGSEGALALGVADTILMQQYAVYRPLSPEETVPRLVGSSQREQKQPEAPILTAHECRELGIIDEIVPEPEGGAHNDPDEASRELQLAILSRLAALAKTSTKKLVENRYKKFRNMGEYSSHSQAAMRREVSLLKHIVVKPEKEPSRERKKQKQPVAGD
jgi:acetyl-CoA carboxylase carboxyl transferase subunit beta